MIICTTCKHGGCSGWLWMMRRVGCCESGCWRPSVVVGVRCRLCLLRWLLRCLWLPGLHLLRLLRRRLL